MTRRLGAGLPWKGVLAKADRGASRSAHAGRLPVGGGAESRVGAVCAVAAAGCALALSCYAFVVKPARDLESGMRAVVRGECEAKVDVPATGPLRNLAVSFNEMARELSISRELREEFLANVSHELKTPLSYLQSFATLLQDERLSEEERNEYLQGIATGTRRLSKMVSSMFELAMAGGPENYFEFERFSLDEQLRHVLAVFVPIMEHKGVEYDVDFEDAEVEGNRGLLAEVWANLLSNAVKYTSSGGRVSVRLRRDGEAVAVTVADTGIGIEAKEADRVFERFHRDQSAANYEGVGLGLSIAKAIVDRHHGSISLESSPGKGAAFIVKLPVAASCQARTAKTQ